MRSNFACTSAIVTDTVCNVLLSSAGRRGALLQIARESIAATGARGVVVAADMSLVSAAMALADERAVVPPCRDERFIPEMLELCRRHAIRLLVPTIDTELPMLAAARDHFAEVGTRALVSGAETVKIAGDKVLTHEWLSSQGFPVVRQARAEDAISDASWSYPMIAKPRDGSASVGLAQPTSADDLRRLLAPGLLVQTIAPGIEHTVDVWVDRTGKARSAVPRRRIEVRAGEVSKGVTVRSPALQNLCRAIAETLPDAYGPITIQAFVDGNDITIIEINARLGGGFPLSDEAGAHFVRWGIEDALGIESTASDEWHAGLVMLRYDAAAYVEASAVGL
jgi:carbamoyl-phosphate synthase large subunit